jgi:hypothetical protein
MTMYYCLMILGTVQLLYVFVSARFIVVSVSVSVSASASASAQFQVSIATIC